MNKNLVTPLLLIGTFFYSCSKSSQPKPNPSNTGESDDIKIELVSGGNQTDTIGWALPEKIVVKVTKNGVPVANYKVAYQGSGCNSDRNDTDVTDDNGTANYSWSLAGDVGQQALKVYAIDDQNKKADSITVLSTAISPGNSGWHFSACTYPFGFTETPFCKLSTGRLFTALLGGPTFLKYSDDNGISWNAVKALGNTHRFEGVISSATDELFAYAEDANYYSKDKGESWTTLPIQKFNTGGQQVSGAIFTKSGKIFVTTQYQSLYISSDKGQTWTIIPPSAITFSGSSNGADSNIACPQEDKDGNLYVLGLDGSAIHRSTDGGKTWTPLPLSNYRITAFYIDPATNLFYISVTGFVPTGFYVSKDTGATFNLLMSTSGGFNNQLSVQNDGNLYYTNSAGIYSFNGVLPPSKFVHYTDSSLPQSYIVSKNNTIIVSTASGSLSYHKE